MNLPGPIRAALAACAVARYPEECCGVILERAGALEVRALPNAAAAPRVAFAFAAGDLLGLLREEAAGLHRIAAIFHSHPDGDAALSEADLAALVAGGRPLLPGVAQVVIAVRGPAPVAAELAVHTFAGGAFRGRSLGPPAAAAPASSCASTQKGV